VIRRFIETVGRRDLEGLDALVTADYRHQVQDQALTLAELKQVLGELFAAFSDLASTIDEVTLDGDAVVVHWTGIGTHDGPFMGIAPTGRSVRIDGANRFRVRDGLIASDEPQWRLDHVLRQIR
jgi:steroid delta-isomerase-like uncharacterized protein